MLPFFGTTIPAFAIYIFGLCAENANAQFLGGFSGYLGTPEGAPRLIGTSMVKPSPDWRRHSTVV
jgi:hypothetical protein